MARNGAGAARGPDAEGRCIGERGQGAVQQARAARGVLLLNQSGFDRGAPAAEINQRVEIIHEFLDMKDNAITQVKVGQEFLVRLRLRAAKRDSLPQLAVVDLLPGGVEAVLELRPQADSSAPGADPAAMNARRVGAAHRSGGEIGLVSGAHRRARRPAWCSTAMWARMPRRSCIA